MKDSVSSSLSFDSIDLDIRSIILQFKTAYYIHPDNMNLLLQVPFPSISIFLDRFIRKLKDTESPIYVFSLEFIEDIFSMYPSITDDIKLKLYDPLQIMILKILHSYSNMSADQVSLTHKKRINDSLTDEVCLIDSVIELNTIDKDKLKQIIPSAYTTDGSNFWTLTNSNIKIVWL